MQQLILIDQSLRHLAGHHYPYAVNVLQAAATMLVGWVPAGNRISEQGDPLLAHSYLTGASPPLDAAALTIAGPAQAGEATSDILDHLAHYMHLAVQHSSAFVFRQSVPPGWLRN